MNLQSSVVIHDTSRKPSCNIIYWHIKNIWSYCPSVGVKVLSKGEKTEKMCLPIHMMPHSATIAASLKNDTSSFFSSLTDISAQNGPREATTSVPPSDHDEDNSPGYTGKATFFELLLSFQCWLIARTTCTVSLCNVQNIKKKCSNLLLSTTSQWIWRCGFISCNIFCSANSSAFNSNNKLFR